MKENIQRNIYDYLQKKGIENFIGVPDSTLKHFVDQGLKKNKIIIATREEEAIGIGVGMSLAKSPSLIFMQNAGFANVVKTTIFLTDMSLFSEVNEIYGQYFTGDYPARETVAVKGLPKNVNVEISMIAAL